MNTGTKNDLLQFADYVSEFLIVLTQYFQSITRCKQFTFVLLVKVSRRLSENIGNMGISLLFNYNIEFRLLHPPVNRGPDDGRSIPAARQDLQRIAGEVDCGHFLLMFFQRQDFIAFVASGCIPKLGGVVATGSQDAFPIDRIGYGRDSSGVSL